jgi:hypothetical protein
MLPDPEPKREGGFPGDSGFGDEEWNFQVDDNVEGYVYGFLNYRPSAKVIRESGDHFRIVFWTLHPDRRQKFIVGCYENAVLATDADLKAVGHRFEKMGIYERRAKELSDIPGLTAARARKHVHNMLRNLRFKVRVEDVHVLNGFLPLGNRVGGKRVSLHFKNPTILDGSLDLPAVASLSSAAAKKLPGGHTTPLAEDGYIRESPAHLKVIIPKHNRLSNSFAKCLKARGYKSVKQEIGFVDIEFIDGDDLCRAELKTCYGTTTTKAIREALGQLLEYNYYGDREPAARWVIVLDRAPSDADLAFLRALVKIPLPLSLAWPVAGGFKVERFTSHRTPSASE